MMHWCLMGRVNTRNGYGVNIYVFMFVARTGITTPPPWGELQVHPAPRRWRGYSSACLPARAAAAAAAHAGAEDGVVGLLVKVLGCVALAGLPFQSCGEGAQVVL